MAKNGFEADNEKEKKFVNKLFDWYEENKRDFPWRKTSDPYEVLIAEILLQRTRAKNVVPVYENFLEKYPTVGELSEADTDNIENTIESLGLYEPRAKRLKNIARKISEEHEGEVPLEEEKLLEMKGIGHYISRATLCFTNTEEKAVVDWNVTRVVERFFGYDMKSSPHTDKEFMDFMQKLLPEGNGKKFNWAVLDFGAEICKPRNPDCENCFLSSDCVFF